ncbi:hypothetical protein [Methyloterricola oryzae]|uniref:hypothetical protein n=1 Tax=Methyloterricola oryzae TaxID=1495050 RepID=UPI00069AE4E2|nr:hypothetical protein [Methyloterricola oryzae]
MKRYLLTVACVAAAILMCVAAINSLIDPWALWGTHRYPGLSVLKPSIGNHEREFEHNLAVIKAWDAIILGTSRSDRGLDPQHPAFRGLRTANLAIDGQPPEESFNLFDVTTRRGARKAVIGLDFVAANVVLRTPPDSMNVPRPASWSRLISMNVLRASFETIIENRRHPVSDPCNSDKAWREDGFRCASSIKENLRADARNSFLLHLNSLYRPKPSREFSFANPTRDPMKAIRALLERAHERGVDLRLLISPSHAWQWEAIYYSKLWDQWEEWKRRIVELNRDTAEASGSPPFPIWDFSGYNSITTEKFPPAGDSTTPVFGYWETSHYTKAVGDMVLDRIFGTRFSSTPVPADFGVSLDVTNLESHLTTIREQRRLWLRDHKEEAEELEKLAREAH